MNKILTKTLLSLCLLLAACSAKGLRHNQRGNEYLSAGSYNQAVYEYRLAQLEEPNDAVPYFNSAIAYYHLGQLDAVILQSMQALRTANPSLVPLIWYNLGNAYFDAEEWAHAVAAYKQTLRLTPEDQDAKVNLELAMKNIQHDPTGSDEGQEQISQVSPTQAQKPSSDAETLESKKTSTPTPIPLDFDNMTSDQIIQQLENLLGEQTTLQEQTGKAHDAPGSVPQYDW